MIKIGIYNNKLNKKNLEILRNLEILCFIDKINIKKYGDKLIKDLHNFGINNSFINYIKNYWLKKIQILLIIQI